MFGAHDPSTWEAKAGALLLAVLSPDDWFLYFSHTLSLEFHCIEQVPFSTSSFRERFIFYFYF